MELGTWYGLEDFIKEYNQFAKATQQENREKLLAERDYYHRDSFFPEWMDESQESFVKQVLDMASATKPFKATDTFKIQAGYPHEVEESHKKKLEIYGVRQDKNLSKENLKIPKMNTERFTLLMNGDNLISFCTPKDTDFIRELIVHDSDALEDYHLFYVISRKARILSTWTIKKEKGKQFVSKISSNDSWKYRQP